MNSQLGTAFIECCFLNFRQQQIILQSLAHKLSHAFTGVGLYQTLRQNLMQTAITLPIRFIVHNLAPILIILLCVSLSMASLAHAEIVLQGKIASGTISSGTLTIKDKNLEFKITAGTIKSGKLVKGNISSIGNNPESSTLTQVEIEDADIENAILEENTIDGDKFDKTPHSMKKNIAGKLSNATINNINLKDVIIDDEVTAKPVWYGKVGNQKFELENPGYFDVGIGFTYLGKTNNSLDATGLLATIKAYPWKRWYAPRKKPNILDVMKENGKASTSGDGSKKAEAEVALDEYLKYQADLYPVVIPDQDDYINRFSVFYGHSIGNYDAANIPTSVNAIGVEYDIAPEFALMLGFAAYPSNSTGTISSPTIISWIFGVQMNTNAFESFRHVGGN